ncbi:MAG: hypothetical protein BGO10_00540 [Chlamydia sp. 32-24]|nr:MAG: hypothetical protein BGO10_00540 [Chlamydia sp. 32-24]
MTNKLHSKIVKIESVKIFSHHLEISHLVDEASFLTKVFYYDVNLLKLLDQYSNTFLNAIYAHIALSETFKYCSLFPETIDISAISSHLNEKSLEFFKMVLKKGYSQCLYENNRAEYSPNFIFKNLGDKLIPSHKAANFNETIVVGNGGGKDSFLAMKILEASNLNYAFYQWTRSEYGRSQFQLELCDKLLALAKPSEVHKVSVFDDFSESPFIKLYYPHLKGSFTLGIPECIFEALPFMLQHGYHTVCFANEKSSDTGNLFWDKLGSEVNHQWVKSLEAELYFQKFIQQNLLENYHFFSVLKPLYDYRIFQNLSKYPEFVKKSHSCNVDKPWCKKCAKCAYVWLGFLAHFDKKIVDDIFGTNPFDDDDLIFHYKNMLGIEGHRSFECIGNIEECQLFMKKCIAKGLQGKMVNQFLAFIKKDKKEWEGIEEKYNQVYDDHNIPRAIFEKMKEYI